MRVSHCGVCHSDLSLANGTFPVDGADRARPRGRGRGRGDRRGRHRRSRSATRSCSRRSPVCNACYWCVRGEYGCCVNNARDHRPGTFSDGRTPLSRHGAPVLRGVGLGGFAEFVITPETGRDQGARRHAARDRVRDRLRGADRSGRGAQHRARARRRDGARGRRRAGSASRSCRARASRARRASSSPIRSRERREIALRVRRHRRDRSRPPRTWSARVHAITERHRCRRRVRRGRVDGRDRDVHLVDAQRRHDGAGRRGRPRSDGDARAAGDVHDERAQDHGLRSSAAATAAATSRACSTCGARVGSTSRA